MPTSAYALIMLAAGIGVPVLAALNAQLGKTINAPAAASVVLFAVALLVSLAVVAFTGPKALSGAVNAPRYLWLGGVLVAFYVLSITFIAPHFGVGNAVFFVLLGQLISAAMIDHFGLFGATQTPLSLTRATGIAVMALGVGITQMVR